MKERISVRLGLAAVGLALAGLCAVNVAAEDFQKSTAASNNAEAATFPKAAPVQLSTGTWDVLKLVQSKVGDDTTIAFINSSGASYGLGAPEIIYLREQGVSERVITAMLTQHKTAAAHAPAPANTVWAAAPAPSSTTEAAAAPAYSQPTTVYVTPPAQSYVNYYPSYPYYYPYYSPVSLSFGIGFGYYGGCYGGYYCGGGGYHGGYHGGGSHGGHH
jgi:hypothetical protein